MRGISSSTSLTHVSFSQSEEHKNQRSVKTALKSSSQQRPHGALVLNGPFKWTQGIRQMMADQVPTLVRTTLTGH